MRQSHRPSIIHNPFENVNVRYLLTPDFIDNETTRLVRLLLPRLLLSKTSVTLIRIIIIIREWTTVMQVVVYIIWVVRVGWTC